jgi:hypothetical protein
VFGGSESFEIVIDGLGRIVNQLFAAAQQGLASSVSLTDGVWTHVAVTYDYVTGHQHIYLDGQLVGFHPSVAHRDPVSCRLTLGNRTGMPDPFRGIIDDIRMYDRVLRAQEIVALVSDIP